MEMAKKFKTAINRTCSDKGGVLWQGISDHQLTTYIMDILEDFSTNGGSKVFGSLTIGRQPNPRRINSQTGEFVDTENDAGSCREIDDFDTAVYILNEHLQVGRLECVY